MGILAAITDLLFPPKCMFCRKILRGGDGAACKACEAELTGHDGVRTGTYFSRCVIPMAYEGKVRDAIIRFKFQDQPGYATEFGRILAKCIQNEFAGQYDLITWVPVSEKRRKKRGYDQAMLLAMAAALELEDVESEHAQNGEIAVRMFSESPAGYYDAVLMDVRMPVMDGLSATRAIRALDRPDAKTVPIIAMTANVFDEDVKRSLQAGMDAHLSKPIEPERMYETMAKLIAQREAR